MNRWPLTMNRWPLTSRGRCWLPTSALLGAVALALAIPASQGGATTPRALVNGCSQSDPVAGCQGVVAGLPATASQVSVSGQGSYSGLKVTVNQTTDLTNQVVSVSWTGGAPTFSNPQSGSFGTTYNGNFLQIFECWSAPGSSPQPSQCEFGGESSTPSSSYPIQDIGFQYSRVLSQQSWDGYAQLKGSPGTYFDSADNFVIEPFDAVDGTVVDQQADYNWDTNPFKPQPFWLNPYFSFNTTNEVDFTRTYANGSGTQLFQVDNGLQAPGLGCGQRVEPLNGKSTVPQCWLVAVPRSTPTVENPTNVTNVSSVVTSPLTPQAWNNRIAIPLKFNPVGTTCSLNANPESIIGGELAASAAASWQPAICNLPGHTPFDYIQNNDDSARQNLTNPSFGSAGMSVFSDPIDPAKLSSSKTVVYAPLTLSGVVVGFNIERVPIVESDGSLQPQELALSGDRLEHLYLTPLLIARLLTESYRDQLQFVQGDTSPKYAWVQKNPASLFTDPNFLEYNPEFSQLSPSYLIDAGTLLVEEGSSDATEALWKWVLSDPEARAWLNGTPDKADSGMNVNPYYSTNPKINPAGASFGSPVPDDFPKSDPYLDNTGSIVYGPPPAPARPLGVLDWTPYVSNMATAAADAAAANDQAKTTFNPAATPDLAWTSNGPQETGNDFIITITTSSSAAQYGLQTASLSAAGDDTTDRAFVAPDEQSLLAGEKAMKPTQVTGVLQSNPSTTAGGAYPLTMLTYAATNPKNLSASSKKDYAAFLRYAAGAGQVSGTELGQLPDGYVPLPASLKSETLAAATTLSSTTKTVSSKKPGKKSSGGRTIIEQGTGSGANSDQSSGSSASSVSGSSSSPISLSGGSTDSGSGSAGPTGSGLRGTRSDRPKSKSRPDIGPSALSAVKTPALFLGAIRWTLPLLLLLGICAAIGAGLINLLRRRKLATVAAEPPATNDLGGSEAGSL